MIKTNKYDDPMAEGGKGTMISVEQIRLPSGNRALNPLVDDSEGETGKNDAEMVLFAPDLDHKGISLKGGDRLNKALFSPSCFT